MTYCHELTYIILSISFHTTYITDIPKWECINYYKIYFRVFEAENNQSLSATNGVEKYDFIKTHFTHQQYKFIVSKDCPAL